MPSPRLRPITANASRLGLASGVTRLGVLLLLALVARTLGAGLVGLLTVTLSAALMGVPLLSPSQVEVLIRETAARHGAARELLAAPPRDRRRLGPWLLLAALTVLGWLGQWELRMASLSLVPFALIRTETNTIGAVFRGLDRM
jgi:hypothetical protein